MRRDREQGGGHVRRGSRSSSLGLLVHGNFSQDESQRQGTFPATVEHGEEQKHFSPARRKEK